MDRPPPIIVNRLELGIERRSVLAFLDYPTGHAPPPRIERLLGEMLVEARALVRARGCAVLLAPAEAGEIGLEPREARALGLGLCTAGPEIEARVSELSRAGDVTRAVLLDAAGSAAAEEAADRLSMLLAGTKGRDPGTDAPTEADTAACRVATAACRVATPASLVATAACRLSPGYGEWRLDWQPQIFARLPHQALGVALSPACLMVPRKSVSFAMWLGARGRIGPEVYGCSRCRLGHCRYRRARNAPSAVTGATRRTITEEILHG